MTTSAQPSSPAFAYPAGEPPAPGSVREIAPGVLWARMPLPFSLDHINVWALRDGSRWVLVDTGIQSEATADAWRAILGRGGALADGRLGRVLVTHMHPDHVGMAGWLTRKFECDLWMTRLEYLTCRMLVADTGKVAPQDALRFLHRAGWSDDAVEHYRTRFGTFGKEIYALPDSYRRLRDGERVRIGEHEWRVMVGSGHSPEHACLHCPDLKLFLSGDQVLPAISSNVSVFPTEPLADPLSDWIASVDALRAKLPDDVLVLPAHGEPFVGLHARLEQLAEGHVAGLARLREALAEPRRAVDLFSTLFKRPVDGRSALYGFATGETLAHLNHLMQAGEVECTEDAEGVTWYLSASHAAP